MGGIRYPRVIGLKETTKEELMKIIKPLFFPDGKSCHGEVDDFILDIATDVKGTQLMHDHESVALVMKRLKTKHFRCHLLAKAVDVNSDSSLADEGIPCMKKKRFFVPMSPWTMLGHPTSWYRPTDKSRQCIAEPHLSII